MYSNSVCARVRETRASIHVLAYPPRISACLSVITLGLHTPAVLIRTQGTTQRPMYCL